MAFALQLALRALLLASALAGVEGWAVSAAVRSSGTPPRTPLRTAVARRAPAALAMSTVPHESKVPCRHACALDTPPCVHMPCRSRHR
jgi:hypothetical protein